MLITQRCPKRLQVITAVYCCPSSVGWKLKFWSMVGEKSVIVVTTQRPGAMGLIAAVFGEPEDVVLGATFEPVGPVAAGTTF